MSGSTRHEYKIRWSDGSLDNRSFYNEDQAFEAGAKVVERVKKEHRFEPTFEVVHRTIDTIESDWTDTGMVTKRVSGL